MGMGDPAPRRTLKLLHHPTGTEVTRTPDWVVLATPASPVEWLYNELRAAGVSVERVGDCVAPRRAHAAVIEGERAGAAVLQSTNTEPMSTVAVVMGSTSDWPTMSKAVDVLQHFDVQHEVQVLVGAPDARRDVRASPSRQWIVACEPSSPVPAAPPTCRACWPPRRRCQCSVCLSHRAISAGRTRCTRSCRCRPACPWRRSPSGKPAPPTQRCSPSPCWRASDARAGEGARRSTDEQRHDDAAEAELLRHDAMITPPATLGILGGGQLGKYFVEAARTMGYRTDGARARCRRARGQGRRRPHRRRLRRRVRAASGSRRCAPS